MLEQSSSHVPQAVPREEVPSALRVPQALDFPRRHARIDITTILHNVPQLHYSLHPTHTIRSSPSRVPYARRPLPKSSRTAFVLRRLKGICKKSLLTKIPSVIPSGRYRGVTVLSCEMKRRGFGYKRSLFPLIKGFCFRSHGVDACLTLRPDVRRDGSGSVSSYLPRTSAMLGTGFWTKRAVPVRLGRPRTIQETRLLLRRQVLEKPTNRLK